MEHIETTDLTSYIPGYDDYIGSDKEETKKECSKCPSSIELYKYENKIYCYDCLLKQLEKEDILSTNTVTEYRLGGEFVCTDDDEYLLIEELIEDYEVEKI